MLDKKQVYQLMSDYHLIKDEMIILSGASLVLQDVKEFTNDIDIAVSEHYLKYLLNNFSYGLEFYNYEKDFGVYYIDNIINFSINYNDVEYIILNGYKVQTLSSIIKLKENLNREKDHDDIEKIKKFLKK